MFTMAAVLHVVYEYGTACLQWQQLVLQRIANQNSNLPEKEHRDSLETTKVAMETRSLGSLQRIANQNSNLPKQKHEST